jgi:3-hydroxyisobutyrate dehydrogenase
LDSSAPIGLIGCGSLGAALGERLLYAGKKVVAWNRSATRLQPLLHLGAVRAASVAEVVSACKATIICLTDAAAILDAFESYELRAVYRDRKLVINTSTVGPRHSAELERFFARRDLRYVDVPVSGGPEGARAGTLALLVGSVSGENQPAMEALNALSPRQVMVGNNALAQTLKILNNLCESVNLWGAAEAIAVAQRYGIALDTIEKALTTGRGDSVYLRVLLDRLQRPREDVSVPLEIRRKDLSLALDLAVHVDVNLPLTKRTAELFSDVAATFGDSVDQTECVRARAFSSGN